jgi:hypothetical protein
MAFPYDFNGSYGIYKMGCNDQSDRVFSNIQNQSVSHALKI